MSREETPVVPGRLYGLRRWSVEERDGSPSLCGAAKRVCWRTGGQPTRALCAGAGRVRHRAPAADCGCGLYALHPRPEVARELYRAARDGEVVGVVAAWGRVEVHESGFRAQFAQPVALVLPVGLRGRGARRIHQLAAAYGAETLRLASAGELLLHCLEHNMGLGEETVDELLAGERAHAALRERRRRRWGRIAEVAGMVFMGAFSVAWALFLLALGGGFVLAIFGAFGEEADERPPAAIPGRQLRIVEQALLDTDDGVLYVALVENRSRRHTALGVYPDGEFQDSSGQFVGMPDDRFAVDQRPTLAPGQTGVVFDDIEDPELLAADVARFRIRMYVREHRQGLAEAPVTASRARFDRRRCLITAELRSTRALPEVEVVVVGRSRDGSIDGVGSFPAGPLRRGRSLQVLDRVPPGACAEGLPALTAYPNLRPGQLFR